MDQTDRKFTDDHFISATAAAYLYTDHDTLSTCADYTLPIWTDNTLSTLNDDALSASLSGRRLSDASPVNAFSVYRPASYACDG